MLDFFDLEGVEGQGNNTFKEGNIVSWADECDGTLDNVSAVSRLDCEGGGGDSDGGFLNWEKIKEPLVVQPLAMANPVPLVEVAGAPMQLSPWVEKRFKAFRKFVGTSLEGFEAEITGFF